MYVYLYCVQMYSNNVTAVTVVFLNSNASYVCVCVCDGKFI